MNLREIGSVVVLSATALTLGVGCPEESKPVSTSAPTKTVAATATAKSTAAATATAAATSTAAAVAAKGAGTIKGVVNFTGKAPEMKVPAKRKDSDVCRDKQVKFDAVVVNNGKLKDALVRIEVGGVKGDFATPSKKAEVQQLDCMYSPRIQGVMTGQEIEIKNGDATLHNVHTFKGAETLFNQAQPKGSPSIAKSWDDAGVIKFACDVHPWMRGFVIVTDHPFFAVSGEDGSFTIDKVPPGKYNFESWHSQYGWKKTTVEVADGKTAEATLSYDGTEAEPAENKDELKSLW